MLIVDTRSWSFDEPIDAPEVRTVANQDDGPWSIVAVSCGDDDIAEWYVYNTETGGERLIADFEPAIGRTGENLSEHVNGGRFVGNVATFSAATYDATDVTYLYDVSSMEFLDVTYPGDVIYFLAGP